MSKKIKWGIIGCGGIAGKFASDLKHTKLGVLHAVSSRSKAKAQKFAAAYGAKQAYSSYEKLVRDHDIDVVYVATPHPYHMDNTLLAIDAGKHVLCEKPIAMNAAQTRRMIAAVRKKSVFLMEAMWTRFFPAVLKVKKWLDEKRIGDVLAFEADFGINRKFDPKNRLFNPELGGGALLDLGIYPVSFASFVYGTQPCRIVSNVHIAKSGVDDHAVIAFEYPDTATAVLSCASRIHIRHEARIFGTEGAIFIHPGFFHPYKITLEQDSKKPKTIKMPHPGYGMQFEAEHVHKCLKNGLTQSPVMPLDESLAIMQTMDKIRRQWKLKYPDE